jgi:hypothetical protein
MNDDVKEEVQIGLRGLWRFFDEGYTCWPAEKLTPLFRNIDLNHPEIQEALRQAEAKGWVRLHGKNDCYLEVLGAPAVS